VTIGTDDPPSYRCLGTTCSVAEAIDPALWRKRYAWGVALGGSVDLKAAIRRCGGTERDLEDLKRLVEGIPLDVIAWHLRSALSDAEIKLGISMAIRRYKGMPTEDGFVLQRDYDLRSEPIAFNPATSRDFIRLDLPPSLLSVERIRGVAWGNVVLDWTPETTGVHIDIVDGQRGEVSVTPTELRSLSVAFGAVGPAVLAQNRPIPGFWRCDFTCGPWAKYDGKDMPGRIELAIADWIGLTAGVRLLSLAGTASGGGIASASLSVDGLSKSFSTTASAMYGLNSALEAVYKEAADSIDWKALRAYKNPMRVIAMSTRSLR
jgi:hypothetical protein